MIFHPFLLTWAVLFAPGDTAENPHVRGPEWVHALATIRSDELKLHLTEIASDAYQGRCAGEPGCERAAQYIIRQLEELEIQPAGDEGRYLQSFQIRVNAGKGAKASTANIVAALAGTDPELGNENVVIGAHYDHVGTADSPDAGRAGKATAEDRIWNGADDNGSGTVSLLEIVEAFVQAGIKPRRTIVFVWFGAEEEGLLGSAHYCAAPFGRPIAMVNMDMVGRNPRKPMEISGMGSMKDKAWYGFIDRALEVVPDLKLKLDPATVPGSDDYSFVRVRVPAVALFTGYHPQYHKVGDHVALVDFDRMTDICKFSLTLVGDLANADSIPPFEPPTAGANQGKMLGIETETLETAELDQLGRGSSQGGVRVTGVSGGSVAEKIGLRVGDVIISVRGRDLSRDNPESNLRRAIRGAAFNQDHVLKVLRDGKETELSFRFERKTGEDD